MHEAYDLKAVGHDIVAPANALGFGQAVLRKTVIFGLPAAAVSPGLLSLKLVKFESELGIVETCFALGNPGSLIGKYFA